MTSKLLPVSRPQNILLSNNSNLPSYPPKSLSRFLPATIRASADTSRADTCRYLPISARLMAMHPEPVHMSSIRFSLSFCSSRTSSTSVSVSCLGISTCSFTRNSKPMNSCVPVRCWRGVRPALISMSLLNSRHFPSVSSSFSSSLPFMARKDARFRWNTSRSRYLASSSGSGTPALFSS